MNLNSLPDLAIVAKEGLDKSNVGQWFNQSLTEGDLLAITTRIRCNLADHIVDPKIEPKYVLLNIARDLIDDMPVRILLESQNETWGISIDIISVKQAPADMIDDTLIDDKTVDLKAPLLVCRYRVLRQVDGIAPMQTWVHSFSDYDTEHRNMIKPDLKLDSSLDFLLLLLEQNSALLSSDYINEWKATSTFNESGFFKPSFLIPLPRKQRAKANEVDLRCAFPSCGKKWSKVSLFLSPTFAFNMPSQPLKTLQTQTITSSHIILGLFRMQSCPLLFC